MKIGIDLTVIQGAHRMRGIGSTLINFINNLPEEERMSHTFVFYMFGDENTKALDILNLKSINYEIIFIKKTGYVKVPSKRFPARLGLINTVIDKLYAFGALLVYGDRRITKTDDLDVFIQFDQSTVLPVTKAKKVLILYDLIPYVLESEYLWNYRTARNNGRSRKGSLKCSYLRWEYITSIKLIARKADELIAISQHTKSDFIAYTGLKPEAISVVHLGVNKKTKKGSGANPGFEHYIETSWGEVARPCTIGDKPFLLFVGGVDPRRKLIDLAAAFNNLRARGHDMQLVLAGDTMFGPQAMPNKELGEYLENMSYLSDVHFLGFISDEQRDWLYKNALAFVYPSVYEGFGLPVLEAMQHSCPVICYKNSSIPEVARGAALYANGFKDILTQCSNLLEEPVSKKKLVAAGKKQAMKFSWHKTACALLEILAED